MKRVTVIGAGTMGHGIAHVAAVAGYQVAVTDSNPGALELASQRIRQTLEGGVQRSKITAEEAKAAEQRLSFERDLDRAVAGADLVIEAVVEDLAVKRALFARLDGVAAGDAVLATNTSSLSIADIAAGTRHPARVVGMHFFNPAHIMKLVEVVTHAATTPPVVDAVLGVARADGQGAHRGS